MASLYQNRIIKEMQKKGYTVIKVIRLSQNGYPDLLCMKENEIDIWIECKESNDTLKPLQKHRIDELIRLGKKAYCTQNGKGIVYPNI